MARHLRGCAHAQLGEPLRAVEDFGRAIALDPDDISSLRNRAILYRETGEPEKAVRDYDEVLRLDPDDSSSGGRGRKAVEEIENAEETQKRPHT